MTLPGFVSAKRKVRAGTKIVVTVSHPGMITAIKTLTVRKKQGPAGHDACQAPGQANRRSALGDQVVVVVVVQDAEAVAVGDAATSRSTGGSR